jgi:hypothetical protein
VRGAAEEEVCADNFTIDAVRPRQSDTVLNETETVPVVPRVLCWSWFAKEERSE